MSPSENVPLVATGFPVLGVAAWSGTGKTTLLTSLLPALRERDVTAGVIKHAHHSFEVDKAGKDSYQLRKAGAAPMLVASHQRYALMQETPGQQEPDLNHLLSLMEAHVPDLVIVEGFKAWPLPKLVLYREEVGDPGILEDPWACAAALKPSDTRPLREGLVRLSIDDVPGIAEWIHGWVQREY